jgi:lantibiotic transport system permease protein
MKTLILTLSTETLKMKRTLGFWLTLLAPLVVAGLEFLVMISQGEDMMEFANGTPWLWHMKFTLTLWGLFVLPLFVTLETALLAGWEHGNGTWKLLYAQPVPRGMVTTAKQFSGLVLLGISHLFLGLAVIGTGLLLRHTRPELGFDSPVPWAVMLGYGFLIFLIAWLIISVHSFVSIRWNSFVVAMAVGIVATMSGVFFINSEKCAPYYPWAMQGLIANKLLEDGWPIGQLIWGIGGGILIFLVSNLYLSRRDVL